MAANAPSKHRVVVPPNPDAFPGILRVRAQWLLHCAGAPYAARDTLDKRGCVVRAGSAPVNAYDCANLCAFAQTWSLYAAGGWDGVGYSVQRDVVFIDIDECRRPDGTLVPSVARWLRRLGTYCQWSMNDGVHAILEAVKPVDDCVFWLVDPVTGQKLKVEIYDRKRYIRMTGHVPAGLPSKIVANQQGLDEFIAALSLSPTRGARSYGNGHAREAETAGLSDEEVLRRARNLPGADGVIAARLLDRGRSDKNPSDEDHQFFKILLNVTRDVEKVDRVARTTAMYRPKWDKPRGGDPWSL